MLFDVSKSFVVNPVYAFFSSNLLPGPGQALVARPPTDPALYARTETIVRAGTRHEMQRPYLGTRRLFRGHFVRPGQETDLAFMPLAEDPSFHDRYGFPLYEELIAYLQSLVEVGIDFDALYVIHEAEKGLVREGEPIPAGAFRPAPLPETSELSAKLGDAVETRWRHAAAPLRASRAIASAAAAAAVSAGPMFLALDPVLLGAAVGPGRPVVAGEPASWFFIAAWKYGERKLWI